MYLFPGAVITKLHKLDDLKQQKCILTVLEVRSLRSRPEQVLRPLKAPGQGQSLACLSTSGVASVLGVFGL